MQSSGSEPRILVIGCGNLLRCDDAAGRMVAERLAAGPHPLHAVSVHQLTPELAVDVAAVHALIIVDASMKDPPGAVRWRRLRPAQSDTVARSHLLSPALLLTLAGKLFGRCPRSWIVSIGGERWDEGEQPSQAMLQAIEQATVQILGRVRRLCAARRRPCMS
jgi:hydrogenase maturation protease